MGYGSDVLGRLQSDLGFEGSSPDALPKTVEVSLGRSLTRYLLYLDGGFCDPQSKKPEASTTFPYPKPPVVRRPMKIADTRQKPTDNDRPYYVDEFNMDYARYIRDRLFDGDME